MNRSLSDSSTTCNAHAFRMACARAVADEARLRAALEAADVAPLAMVLTHLTGDDTLLEALRPHIHGPWNFMQSVPPELRQRVRDELVLALQRYAADGASAPTMPSHELLKKIMQVCVGQEVPEEYIPMLLEEMRFDQHDPRTVSWRQQPEASRLEQFQVLIIGAGASGLCMAIKLQEAGIRFRILEKNATVGGTWYENAYPGCGVDTPNHFYSFSVRLY